MSFEVIAMAASAGGLEAVTHVLAALPRALPVTIAVVQHLDPRHQSLMAKILGRRTPLTVKEAEDGEKLELGTVYVGPPNKHFLVNLDHTVSLSQGELVHFVRPSADLLFETVAATYRERAIAVVLSGAGSDGAIGVRAVKSAGGTVLAQDQASSEYFGMPRAAILTGCVDLVLPLNEMSGALVSLVETGVIR